MEQCFSESKFSKHFNRLAYLGVWPDDSMNLRKKKLYYVYQIFCLLYTFLAIGVQMVDIYVFFGNIRKMAFNLCTSVIVVFTLVKVLIILFFKKKTLDELRWNLWNDSLKFTDEEDAVIMDEAFKKVKSMANFFYISGRFFFPAWIIVSYFSYLWGPRQLPFPAYFPVDLMKDRNYVPLLIYQSVSGGYFAVVVIEIELALYSLILQVEAQYKILKKNILKLNELYEEEVEIHYVSELGLGSRVKSREMNEYLKKKSTKELLKSYINHHLQIIEYSYTFEQIFNEFMLLHVTGSSILCVANGLALLTVTRKSALKLCYQAGYLAMIMADLFFVCHYISNLAAECCGVGGALYTTSWYKMDSDLRKIIYFIIARSQKPPKITTAKLFLMNLSTYLQVRVPLSSFTSVLLNTLT